MVRPTQPNARADECQAEAEQEIPSGGHMTNIYDSVSSTAQAAYNQIPSLEPLRSLLPGSASPSAPGAKVEESENGAEAKGDQTTSHPSIQPPAYPEASGDTLTKDGKPKTGRPDLKFRFIPHQAAAHSASASSISRDGSTRGIQSTSPISPSGEANRIQNSDTAFHSPNNTSTSPLSARVTERSQLSPSSSERIKFEGIHEILSPTAIHQSSANIGQEEPHTGQNAGIAEADQPMISKTETTIPGKTESTSEVQTGAPAIEDIGNEETHLGEEDEDIEGEMGKKEKLKKRLGGLTDKVKAKLHK